MTSAPSALLADIAAALARDGLILRGGFSFGESEAAPPGPSANPARSVLLVGQAGAEPWPHFLDWRQRQPDNIADPLDIAEGTILVLPDPASLVEP